MQVSRYVLAWLVVTILVTATAWGVVATASDQVNDVPIAPIIDANAPTTLDPFVATSPSTAQSTTTVIGSPGSSSATTTPGSASSTTNSGTVPSTTIPGSTTSTTTPSSTATTAPESGTKTISTTGGTVTVSYSNGDVFFEGASPAIGYSAEVEDSGPEKVRVDFEGDHDEVSVRVEWKNGKLDIQIE